MNKTFSKEEENDLKTILKGILKNQTTNNLLEAIQMHLQTKGTKDETVALDALTSFLEVSQVGEETFARSPLKNEARKTTENLVKSTSDRMQVPKPGLGLQTSPPVNQKKSRIPVKSPTSQNKENISRTKSDSKLLQSKNNSLKPLTDNNRKFRSSSPIKLPKIKKDNQPLKPQAKASRVPTPIKTGTLSKTPMNAPVSKPTAASNLFAKPALLTKPLSKPTTTAEKPTPMTTPAVKSAPLTSPVFNSAPEILDVFPIQANRLAMNWISVPLNCKTEQIIVLKNIVQKKLYVNLAIKDSHEFLLSNGKQNQEIELDPGNSSMIRIMFQPKSLGQRAGIFSIRIHGFKNSRGKAIKTSVQLRGFPGRPDINVTNTDFIKDENFNDENTMKVNLYEMSNDVATVKEIDLVNHGEVPGFVSFEAFLDQALKSKSDLITGPIRIDHGNTLIKSGENFRIKLRIDPDIVESKSEPQFIGILIIHSSSDLARKILQSRKERPEFALASDANLEEIKRHFKNIHESDLKQCEMKKVILKIFGARNGESFYSLPVEETLSESMMNVSSVSGAPKLLLSTPVTCETIEEEEIVEDVPKVVAEREKIFIPPVKIGESTMVKVKLKNHGPSVQELLVSALKEPFSCNYANFEIKPKFFMNVPIFYSPKVKGNFEATITFTSKSDTSMPPIHVLIKASTLK